MEITSNIRFERAYVGNWNTNNWMTIFQNCIVHVLFILWKWTYFHILIIRKVKEKIYIWEKLKGTINNYALPIHISVSKKHHVNFFQHLFLHQHITKQKNVNITKNTMQNPHSWNKTINIYVSKENIIIIINVYFVIFHLMNGWHMSLPILCNLGW